MDEKLFTLSDLEVWKRGDRYFARYDAGAHQIAMREDEISAEEANQAIQSEEAALKMLSSLQLRLIQAGVDPYIANYVPNKD